MSDWTTSSGGFAGRRLSEHRERASASVCVCLPHRLKLTVQVRPQSRHLAYRSAPSLPSPPPPPLPPLLPLLRNESVKRKPSRRRSEPARERPSDGRDAARADRERLRAPGEGGRAVARRNAFGRGGTVPTEALRGRGGGGARAWAGRREVPTALVPCSLPLPSSLLLLLLLSSASARVSPEPTGNSRAAGRGRGAGWRLERESAPRGEGRPVGGSGAEGCEGTRLTKCPLDRPQSPGASGNRGERRPAAEAPARRPPRCEPHGTTAPPAMSET